MDQGIPKSSREGDDDRTHAFTTIYLLPRKSSITYLSFHQDSTFEFEKRRNVPVRYDRDLVQTTMKAMKRVAEIKARREHAFWKNRLVVFSSPTFTHTPPRRIEKATSFITFIVSQDGHGSGETPRIPRIQEIGHCETRRGIRPIYTACRTHRHQGGAKSGTGQGKGQALQAEIGPCSRRRANDGYGSRLTAFSLYSRYHHAVYHLSNYACTLSMTIFQCFWHYSSTDDTVNGTQITENMLEGSTMR